MINLFNGDCLEKLKLLDENSIDSVVTDPPYGLAFMGKKWDYDVPSVEIWKEVLRVLKPGGHLLSFGGTRTYHRMVINIEDAGFEIRDQIQWLYGSGFPKSHNIQKAIDKLHEEENPDHVALAKKSTSFQGWGTALKPANEPICLARKPISEKTVAANVLKHGTGAMNIDESRVESNDKLARPFNEANNDILGKYQKFGNPIEPSGRWPANVIFDEGAGKILNLQQDNVARFFYCAKTSKSERNAGLEGMPIKRTSDGRSSGLSSGMEDKALAPQQNFHPTVKPIKLMSYLIKLITPPGGVVLDPFMGSGSTGVAAKIDGFRFVGIERDSEYFEIASKRVS